MFACCTNKCSVKKDCIAWHSFVTCFLCLHFRASELAFALDRLPKDELPPSHPFTEVCTLPGQRSAWVYLFFTI